MNVGRFRRVVAAASAIALVGGLLQLGGATAEAKPSAYSVKAEESKLDAIATPKLDWYKCYQVAECTTVKVPRDYDRPQGAKVELALLRIKAKDQKHKIGSLFVNPGGPGGSATELAYFSPYIFSRSVTDKFDIVGMDPRGIAFSDNVTCFDSPREQAPALAGYNEFFPVGSKEEKAWQASDKAVGKACSKDTLAKSMSTAEVARDMELMRRAVGDKKLSYLGFSYGTYLGQVYANMFPDRFRAVVVDGVLDPVAWAGDASNQDQPLEARLRSSAGAWKAMREILVRCDKAGGAKCSFAPGDPVANFALIAQRLKDHPIVETDPETGEEFRFTYADFVGYMLSFLYDPAGYQPITDLLTQLIVITEPPATGRVSTAKVADARKSFAKLRSQYADQVKRPGYGFPYDNGLDAFASVTCTDSKETTKQSLYPAYAAQADEYGPYFGRAWLWSSAICAGDAFTGNDEDAYTGPFTTKTAAPVLLVGDYYDPATAYTGAVTAAAKAPNSRLLTSDSFGHTAYGTSDCTTSAVDNYLLKGTLPKAGKVCKGDIQPFEGDPEEFAASTAKQRMLLKVLTGAAKLP